jgi:hypothetical protein
LQRGRLERAAQTVHQKHGIGSWLRKPVPRARLSFEVRAAAFGAGQIIRILHLARIDADEALENHAAFDELALRDAGRSVRARSNPVQLCARFKQLFCRVGFARVIRRGLGLRSFRL